MPSNTASRLMVRGFVVGLAVLLAACGARSSPSPSPSVELSSIVLDADSAPEGTSHDETGETRAAVVDRVVVSGRESQFLELPGWSDARYSQYSGDGGLFMSLGVQFDTVENAEHAFHLFLNELESEAGYGLDSRTSDEIGDEGKCTEGANRDVGGVHERFCLWRTGQVILVAAGTLDWADLHELADAMNSRARGG